MFRVIEKYKGYKRIFTMNIKIVADSSSNLFSLDGIAYESVPLKLVTDQ